MVLKPLLIVGCMLIAGAAAAQNGQIEVKDAWARATPGKAENGAAYLTIETPAPDKLVAVSSPAAKKSSLHTMTMDGGVMKMRPLDGLEVPANQPVTLKPGGVHIMLQGLNEPLQAGKSFPLTLTFEKAGQRQVEVAVEKPGAMGPEGHAGMQMPMPGHR
jgi:periplasmic copper chaperone A